MGFFYNELFTPEYVFPENLSKDDILAVLEKYPLVYDENDDQQQWFEKLKAIASSVGYAPDTKEYKKNPEAYKGHVGDISGFIRVAVTGKQNSPDMYLVMKTLGYDKVAERIKKQISRLS